MQRAGLSQGEGKRKDLDAILGQKNRGRKHRWGSSRCGDMAVTGKNLIVLLWEGITLGNIGKTQMGDFPPKIRYSPMSTLGSRVRSAHTKAVLSLATHTVEPDGTAGPCAGQCLTSTPGRLLQHIQLMSWAFHQIKMAGRRACQKKSKINISWWNPCLYRYLSKTWDFSNSWHSKILMS